MELNTIFQNQKMFLLPLECFLLQFFTYWFSAKTDLLEKNVGFIETSFAFIDSYPQKHLKDFAFFGVRKTGITLLFL